MIQKDVSAQNIVEISFSEPSRFKLMVDYRDGVLDPVLVSTDLTCTSTLTITNYSGFPSIECEYNDGSNWTSINSLTNPSISISASSVNVGIYNVVLTISSAINSSEASQDWILYLLSKTFRLKVSDSFVQQIINDGNMPFVFEQTPFYAFETDFGTPPKPTIITQPQNTTHDAISGSSFSLSYKFYEGNLVNSDWQYSDDYNENNPQLATWNDMDSGTLTVIPGDMNYLAPTYQQAAPSFVIATATLSVPTWTAGRFYRYKYVVV